MAKVIRTRYIKPPIPTTAFDWRAWYEGDEELCHSGWGSTEAEAKQDLIDNHGDDNEVQDKDSGGLS